MNNTFLLIGLFVVLGVGLVAVKELYLNKETQTARQEANLQEEAMQTEATQMTEMKNISVDELSQHNKENDCWVAVNGEVYDVTNFMNLHSGGKQAILQTCGADGTIVFETRGDRGPHPDSVMEKLQELKIGTLSE